MRNQQQIKQAEQAWEKEKAAWTKDSDAAKADKVVRPYDGREVINTGESWKD